MFTRAYNLLTTLVLALALHALGAAPSHAWDGCAAAGKLAGTWRFTTLVTEAKSKGGVGVNGFYELTLAAEDCKLVASLTKTGYAKKTYAAAQRPVGAAVAQLDSVPPQADGVPDDGLGPELFLKLPVTLKSPTETIDVTFEILIVGAKLYGRWEYTGAAWDSAGMAGALLGAQGAGARVAFRRVRQVPCDVACKLDGYYYESNSSQTCQDMCTRGEPVGVGRRAP